MKKKIICIVSHYPDPLINKRLEMLKERYKVLVVYNERGNNNFSKIEEVDYIKMSVHFDNGQFLKRAFSLFKLKKEIKPLLKKENPYFIFAFGLDMLIMALNCGFKNKKIIYEIADLHETIINDSKNIIKKIIKFILTSIEKKACKHVDILSLTSEKYYDVYFSRFVDKAKVVYMPNIPDLKYFKDYKKNNHKDFTVGFIGLVRFNKQMKLLIKASEKTDIKVLFAGDAEDDEIKHMSQNSKNVEYYGRYNYNKEIANLYSKCDCIYSVYDISYNNVKYALPNKLYEAIYCELPILVSDGTYLSELVEKLGVGVKVDSTSLEDLIYKIELLNKNKKMYNEIVENCIKNKKKINMDIYNNKFLEMTIELEKKNRK